VLCCCLPDPANKHGAHLIAERGADVPGPGAPQSLSDRTRPYPVSLRTGMATGRYQPPV